MKLRTLFGVVLLAIAAGAVSAQTDTILVLPFENTSDKQEFNWVGESFALSLSELLKTTGVNVVSNSERKLIQQRLRIPLTTLPSLATSLKLAREGKATLLISGKYNIVPAQGDTAATLNVTVKIIRVNEGRFLNEEMPDGRRITRDINLNDALGNLQTMQGQIAYQILYQRDKSSLAYSQNDMVVAANKIPSRAFEAYIKGLLTPEPQARENYFKNALRLYAEAAPGGTFADAALELGHLYLGQRKLNDSVDHFERVVSAYESCRNAARIENKVSRCNDESYAEASFYIGLIRWEQNNYEQALAVLRPLADDLKLTSVYNSLGSIAVQASRSEKNESKAAALMKEGLDLLKKANESSPDDVNIKFNYGIALLLDGHLPEAADQLRGVIAARPNDGDAYYLLAKALGGQNDPTAAAVDNQARTYLTAGNRYANLEKEWAKSKTFSEVEMRVEQPKRRDFLSVVLSRRNAAPVAAAVSETENLLVQARTQFKNGNDDDALITLRRILASEPMSAESYLILGKIHLRRGDLDQAASSFKTALFWDNRLVDAHVALGRIYLEKGDCLQVKNYSVSALELAPENADALAFKRQAERCSK